MGLLSWLQRFLGGAPPPPPRPHAAAPGPDPAEVYRALRGQVFALRPEQLTPPPRGPLAALMETGYPDAVVTLVAVADGTVSLYFSNGGGVIGAGTHADVAALAGSWLREAAAAADRMHPTTEHPAPAEGRVRFYVVSADGVRTAEAAEDDLGHRRHELSDIFHSAHALIAAIREHAESR